MYIRYWHKHDSSPTTLSCMENEHTTMSYKFLCLEEAAKMPHLPKADNNQQKSLSHCPPENSLIGTLTCCTKPILAPLQHKPWYQSRLFFVTMYCFIFFVVSKVNSNRLIGITLKHWTKINQIISCQWWITLNQFTMIQFKLIYHHLLKHFLLDVWV